MSEGGAQADGSPPTPPSPSVVSSQDALKNVGDRSLLHPFGGSKYAALTDDQIATENERLKLTQRRQFASFAGVVAVVQILVADGVFIAYAIWGVDWRIPTPAIQAWLAATVVQVIAVVLVITRSLFPRDEATRSVDSTD